MRPMKIFLTLMSAAAILCGSIPCSVSAARRPVSVGGAVLEDYWDEEPTEAPTYPPATIEIEETDVYLAPGESYQLQYYAPYYEPFFVSGMSDIVNVSEHGGLISVSPDVTESVTVAVAGRVYSFYNHTDCQDWVNVHVMVQDPTEAPTVPPTEPPTVPPTEPLSEAPIAYIRIVENEVYLAPGETYQLCYESPYDSGNYPVTFTSADPDIVSVDNKGFITVSPDVTESSRVTITGQAYCYYNHTVDEDRMYVYVEVQDPTEAPTEDFLVTPGDIVLPAGEIQKITANRSIVSFTILDESVAHMVKDFVVADAPGSTWLIVESADGETCSVRITVLPENVPDGDVDLDGSLTVADVVRLQKVILNLEKLRYAPAADLDKNGIVNVFDLILIKRAVLA